VRGEKLDNLNEENEKRNIKMKIKQYPNYDIYAISLVNSIHFFIVSIKEKNKPNIHYRP